MTKTDLRDLASAPGGARIGRFALRECGVGEWFVYQGEEMMFATLLVGFESFDVAWDALLGHLLARVRCA